jgi:hypothetical protein
VNLEIEKDTDTSLVSRLWESREGVIPSNKFDNDMIKISDISIIPTVEELLFSGQIFLPASTRIVAAASNPHFLPPGMLRLLYMHFLDLIKGTRISACFGKTWFDRYARVLKLSCGTWPKIRMPVSKRVDSKMRLRARLISTFTR